MRTGRSESEPIVTAICGCGFEIEDGMSFGAGAESPFRSARMMSVRLRSGAMSDSACDIDEPITVMWPILRAGLDSLP